MDASQLHQDTQTAQAQQFHAALHTEDQQASHLTFHSESSEFVGSVVQSDEFEASSEEARTEQSQVMQSALQQEQIGVTQREQAQHTQQETQSSTFGQVESQSRQHTAQSDKQFFAVRNGLSKTSIAERTVQAQERPGRFLHSRTPSAAPASAPANEAPAARSAPIPSAPTQFRSFGGTLFAKSLYEGGAFANDVIGTVAKGDCRTTGSITGETATRSLMSYMGFTALGEHATNIPRYLRQCGNSVVQHENEDEAAAEMLYTFLCRRESTDVPFLQRISRITSNYIKAGCSIDEIPVGDFFAPSQLDFTHGIYLYIDGTYYAYLLVPSDGYKSEVPAGWLSLLVNAGDGIDLDVFLTRQPKDRMIRKLGQQLRINRSKIKETSDTNTDFDDLDSAIRSGYFLKDGLSNHEDFYYLNLLITVTADNPDDLDWKCTEMKKLLISQDMNVQSCNFCQEQALRSSFPLVKLDKSLFERSKRNVLTLGAASCYPFTAYELCDDNGILLGVNKHNNSLIIVDIFDSRIYKNANIAILGTSGSGKTFTMQLMALRMRRKGIQVFIVAPLKGHEFHRACSNIGGAFIQISPASPNCINVMEIRQTDRSVDEQLDGSTVEHSMLAAKIQRLHIFFSLLIPDMNHEERQLLDEAMIRTYAKKGITHDNDTLRDPKHPERYREMPILGDLYAVLKESSSTLRLANILNRLVSGSAKTFNQQTNVSLDNKYIVLDISELTGDLLTVGMFMALDFVWDKAKENRTEEKAIFIDECWQLIGASSNRLAAEFVLEIFKIIRGYGGSAVCATQDLNDFFALEDGKYGKGIINNSKTKVILNLEDEEAQRVGSILHLSEAELMEITHFERGSALISTNNNNVAVEIKCSELEKELITTDRRELQELLKRNGKIERV